MTERVDKRMVYGEMGEIDYRLVYDELRNRLRSAMVHAKSAYARGCFEWILTCFCNPKRLYLDALKRKETRTLDLFGDLE